MQCSPTIRQAGNREVTVSSSSAPLTPNRRLSESTIPRVRVSLAELPPRGRPANGAPAPGPAAPAPATLGGYPSGAVRGAGDSFAAVGSCLVLCGREGFTVVFQRPGEEHSLELCGRGVSRVLVGAESVSGRVGIAEVVCRCS